MENEIVSIDKRKSHRIYSSLGLLLEACRHWAESLENADLLDQISDMEFLLHHMGLADCSDNSISELEQVTTNLISNMDQFLKSMGMEGIDFSMTKH